MNDLSIYNTYKSVIQTGDLLAYRSNSVVGTLIHIWSRPYNHVGMVLRLPDYEGHEDRRWTLAADHRGVALSLLSIDLERYNGEVWWYPLKEFGHPESSNSRDSMHLVRSRIAEFGLCQAGKSYDYGALIKNIWGLVPVELQKYFCSEYVFEAYRQAGLVTGDKAPTPAGLAALDIYGKPIQLIYAVLSTPAELEYNPMQWKDT